MSTAESPMRRRAFLAQTEVERTRRSPLVLACVAVVCGLGLAASAVTLVRAADQAGIFEVIRSDYLQRAARAVRLRDRPAPSERTGRAAERYEPRPASTFSVDPPRFSEAYASEPAAPRSPVQRKARITMAVVGQTIAARRTLCVRVCDGYTFPLGNLGSARDLPTHQDACEAACPGAETALYTLSPGQKADDAAQARSATNGLPYRRLPTAFLFRKRRVEACSCQGPDNVAERLPILLDPTLRSGDVFVDDRGAAKVYAGGGHVPHSPRAFADFRDSPALTRQAQAQVDHAMGVSQREARARAFERALAVREAAARARAVRGFEPVKRVREAYLRAGAVPAGSAANVRVYTVTMDGARLHGSGARIIEVR